MVSLKIELNIKVVMVNTVNGQDSLHRITVDSMFAGYFDTTGKDTNYGTILAEEEIEFIENKIRLAIR